MRARSRERDAARVESGARLPELLRTAYSAELAAALAYRGHWKSVRDAYERGRIRTIEREERHHRRLVGEMLAELGARPSCARELFAHALGRVLGLACHVSGRLVPMVAAGMLESGNVREYEVAARDAARAGHAELVGCLLAMADVEREHERFFRSRVDSHPAWRRMRRASRRVHARFATEDEDVRSRSRSAEPSRHPRSRALSTSPIR